MAYQTYDGLQKMYGTKRLADATPMVASEALGTKAAASVAHGEYTHTLLMQAITAALESIFSAGWQFSTNGIGAESINHIRTESAGQDMQIWFADTSALDSITKERPYLSED